MIYRMIIASVALMAQFSFADVSMWAHNNYDSYEYSALVKNIEFDEYDNGRFPEVGLKQYLVRAKVIESYNGELPSEIQYVYNGMLGNKPKLNKNPFIFSFCKSGNGIYFMPQLYTMLANSEENIAAFRGFEDTESKARKCDINSSSWLP
ncbi:hypothetical protein ACG1BZ_09245 [Microbulbifer sp. CNSA002]|uniref:hypothetical protein n=1 Tax=unclassified Microbulbifer TaxID=2619833 RepID=UPI0039B4930A